MYSLDSVLCVSELGDQGHSHFFYATESTALKPLFKIALFV